MDIFANIAAFFQRETLGDFIVAACILIVTAIAARAVSQTLRHLLKRDESSLPSVSIIVNIARVAVWMAGVSVMLDACFNVNANALVAALGVGGIAISLGFQDTLSNLIGGLQVTFMHIIEPGDHIQVGSNTGVVQDVTWRHTTIEDSLGQRITIPNSIISSTSLVHLLPETRVTVPISVPRPFVLADASIATILAENAAVGTRGPDDENEASFPDASDLDAIANALILVTAQAVEPISHIVCAPTVLFADISDNSANGKIIFQIEDAGKTLAAADAAVRAAAKLFGRIHA